MSWALAVEAVLLVLALVLLLVPDWPLDFVEIRTIPSRALIEPEEGPSLTSPAMLPVPASGVRVRISRPGYLPADTTIELGTGVYLVYLGYLFPVSIGSIPPGAEVRVDGAPAGRTPVVVEVTSPGTHVIEAVSPDSVILRDTIVLAGNRRREVLFRFPTPVSGGLVFIPGGTFDFQSTDGARLPAAPAGLAPYYIGATEVTNASFCMFLNAVDPLALPDSVMGRGLTPLLGDLFRCDYPLDIMAVPTGGYAVHEGLETHPVRGLTVAACLRYCEWLTQVDTRDLVFRLPTEHEWEYAARAGGGISWPWGDEEPDGTLLNCSDSCEGIARRAPWIVDGYPETSPAGSFPPNPWGLRDMAGNVWEWCSDWQGGEASASFAGGDTIRCLRGGSWLSDPLDCRCASRLGLDGTLGYPFAGFRLAAEIPGP